MASKQNWVQACFLIACALSVSASTGSSSNKQPNVLIILADDLGWGDVSFHGSKQIPTPNIDLLASTGVILNNYYVSPCCSPSRSALLTGYNPIQTGMQRGVIHAGEPYGLPLNFTTLGTHFRNLGYGTHLVGKWHQGMGRWEHLPTRRGFDTHFGYLLGMSDYYTRRGEHDSDRMTGYDFRENEARGNVSKYDGQYSTDMYADRVVELIKSHEKNSSKPFMIYFAEQSVHTGTFGAIQPPPRYKDKFTWIANHKRRNFAGMVAALDDSVGKVFRALNETGHLEDTIIFFSNDNGGASGNNHGQFIDNGIGSNHPLKGSKFSLWEGGVRGTAFLWSSQLDRPYISHQLMHITDVLPTLYSAAGGNVTHLGPIDGVNLWPALLNQSQTSIRQHLLHNIDHHNHFWGVRHQNYKLTSGSYGNGNFDAWYTAPGQTSEDAHICYECSDVYKVLSARNGAPSSLKPVTITVDCKAEHHSQRTACVSHNQHNDRDFCLFDLHADPCELNNIAAKHPAVVKRLYALYLSYNATAIPSAFKPVDPKANPALHDGWWEPWL